MKRRQFLTFGFSAAALAALSGCRLRLCGGGISCGRKSYVFYSHRETAPVKIYYHGLTLLFLTPDFHLIHNYYAFDDPQTKEQVPLSKKFFAGIPEKLLEKAYLKHGKEVDRDLLFSGESSNTVVRLQTLRLAWAKHELTAAEIAFFDKLIVDYRAQKEKISPRFSTPPINSRKMNSLFWGDYHSSVSPSLRVPALQNSDDPVYQYDYPASYTPSDIYVAGTFPAGFFDGAKTITYEPATELHGEHSFEAPKHYAWQSRPSPVKIDAKGQVVFNGKIFRPLNIRSAFAPKANEANIA